MQKNQTNANIAMSVGLFSIIISIIIFIALLVEAPASLAQDMNSRSSYSSNQFQRIEQPFAVKIVVTVGGVALIGAQLWWFLGKARKP